MIIWTETDAGVRYYVATNNGRPIFGAKGSAAELSGEPLDQVCRHLRLLMQGIKLGTMTRGERFDPKKHKSA